MLTFYALSPKYIKKRGHIADFLKAVEITLNEFYVE